MHQPKTSACAVFLIVLAANNGGESDIFCSVIITSWRPCDTFSQQLYGADGFQLVGRSRTHCGGNGFFFSLCVVIEKGVLQMH